MSELAREIDERISDVDHEVTPRPDEAPRPPRAGSDGEHARAVLRPGLRRRGQQRGGPAPPRTHREPRRGRPDLLRHGVLRDLVGLDELHLVRHVLRHRRLALPRADHRPDVRRARPRRGRRACVHRPRLHGADPRLRRHARRDGRPVAARITLRREQPPCDPGLRGRYRRSPGLLARPPGAARDAGPDRVHRPRRRGARDPDHRREAGHDALAPPPHHRALRPVHPDPARREPARLRERRHRGAPRRPGPRLP